jgi:hypothetical protein
MKLQVEQTSMAVESYVVPLNAEQQLKVGPAKWKPLGSMHVQVYAVTLKNRL